MSLNKLTSNSVKQSYLNPYFNDMKCRTLVADVSISAPSIAVSGLNPNQPVKTDGLGNLVSGQILLNNSSDVSQLLGLDHGGSNNDLSLVVADSLIKSDGTKLVSGPNALNPSFQSVSATNATNQLLLGVNPNKTTINSVAPIANQSLVIPDSGSVSANFILSESAQTKNGLLTLGTGAQFSNATVGYVPSTLNYFEELLNQSVQMNDGGTPIVSANFVYHLQKLGSFVTLSWDYFTFDDPAGAPSGVIISVVGTIPARFRPTLLAGNVLRGYNLTQLNSSIEVTSAGTIQIVTNVGASVNWNAVGNQLLQGSVTWKI
jgi:hypothetical protein